MLHDSFVPDLAVLFELRDPKTGAVIARAATTKTLGASDPADRESNAERLAAQGLGILFGSYRAKIGQEIVPLRPVPATPDQDRAAVVAFLKGKLPDLKGKALYHPEFTLEAWIRDLEAEGAGEMKTPPV